jgi:hypothetical protein
MEKLYTGKRESFFVLSHIIPFLTWRWGENLYHSLSPMVFRVCGKDLHGFVLVTLMTFRYSTPWKEISTLSSLTKDLQLKTSSLGSERVRKRGV